MPIIPGPRPSSPAPKVNIPNQSTQDKNRVRADSADRIKRNEKNK